MASKKHIHEGRSLKVLVLGASGFIGRNVLEHAPSSVDLIGIYNSASDMPQFIKKIGRKKIQLLQCDLLDEKQVQRLAGKIGREVDHCIFLAGNVDVPFSKNDPKKDIVTTVFTLINAFTHFRIKRLVYVSTAGVYDGNKGSVSIDTILQPTVPYCISKMMAEQYVKYFHVIGNVKEYVILRFGGAFGKYSKPSKFMASLVREIGIERKKSITVYGTGTNIINVMYVKDAVRGLFAALTSRKKNLTSNFGQENMTIQETVERVAKALNQEVTLQYAPLKGEQKYINFRIDADFNRVFSFKAKYSFEEGIRDFCKDLKDES